MCRAERTAVAVVLGAAAFVGCGRPERTLRVVVRSPVASLDPQTTDDATTLTVLSNAYETLVRFEGGIRPAPALAKNWTNPRENAWRFELRRDVRFHDGRPLTAHDVKYTIDRGLTHAESWVRARIPQVASAEVLDDYTVEIVTLEPAPLLLNQLTAVMILPRGLDPVRAPHAVGTGPYRLVSWQPGHDVAFESFAGYWGARPAWSRAVYRPEPDGRARVAAVLEGRDDIADFPPLESLASLQGSPRARLLEHPGWVLAVLGFRVVQDRRNPLADPDVRRALALAVDPGALVQEALAGHAVVARQLAPPGVFGYVPDLPPREAGIAAARAALAGSRFPQGFEAPLYLTARDASLAAFVAGAVRPLGVTFDLREVRWEELDRLMMAREAPAYVFHMTFPNADTSDLLLDGFHTPSADRRYGLLNFSGYANAELDRLLELSSGEMDSRQRYALLRKAMEIAMEARVWLPLCAPANVFAARRGLEWEGNPTGRIRLAEIREAADSGR